MPSVRRFVVFIVALGSVSCLSRWGGSGGGRVNPDVAVPDSFVVVFETTRGRFDVMARTQWAPVGVDRFYQLVNDRYYDDARFFRVVKDFVAQFGLPADPTRNKAWRVRRIADEPVRHGNLRGTLSYARGGAGTRTTQLFINLKDNVRLDTANTFGFPAFGEVISGMSVVDSLYSGYGDSAPRAPARPDTTAARRARADSAARQNAQRDTTPRPPRLGPSQDSITLQGTPYLMRGWPKLDYIKTARVVREWRVP
jgi:peptidyl-prolyl cis-trans isomerase A (cyclophilin A)